MVPMIEQAAEIAIVSTASQPARIALCPGVTFRNRWTVPARNSSTATASGNSAATRKMRPGISFRNDTSAFHLVGVIHVDASAVVVKIENNRQRHGRLGGGEHDHQHREDLAFEPKTRHEPRRGHEIDVR